MKKLVLSALCALFFAGCNANCPQVECNCPQPSCETAASDSVNPSNQAADKGVEVMNLEQNWDKVFKQSDKVDHKKITFRNRFGITLAADMYIPKDAAGKKLPAIAVSGPFGAVKEQSSGLYAQTLAERGFVTVAFDPSFTGESGGEPRYMNSPDINTEDFSAAVDFLATHELVNPEAIGILGICGWGGMAINAAAIDTRIKATVASTMYDMSRVTANNYNDALDTAEARQTLRMQMSEQRTIDYKNGTPERAGGVPESLPDQAPQFMKDYHTYYKTPRGYHKRSLNSNEGWNKTAAISLLNTKLLAYANEIVNPVLIIHGADAHSRYFSEGAFEKMTGKHVENENATVGNKELMIIPDANHIDLYDNMEKIPFAKIESFYKENLK